MYQLKVKDHFDAAHFIKDYPGKCARMHGHRWDVEICLEGENLGTLNMLLDFVFVKEFLRDSIKRLDHYVLNDVLRQDNVTAEFLSREIYKEVGYKLSRVSDEPVDVRLVNVTVWESPDCSVTYSEE